MGDTLTIALIANTTSRIPFATGEWSGHFKNVGMYSRRIAYRDTRNMNKQVLRILEIQTSLSCAITKCLNKFSIKNEPEDFMFSGYHISHKKL